MSKILSKVNISLPLSIAFVAFTTQFGGGFASGVQIYEYFINYGIWCLVLPIFSQFLYAIFFGYGMRFAYNNKLYDYRSFSNVFYGKYSIVFSNLYELTYLTMIATATSAAFATGGSTLHALTEIPYWICTLVVGVSIFLITIYGSSVVRKTDTILSVVIIGGLIITLLPAIIEQLPAIKDTLSLMNSDRLPLSSHQSGKFLPAIMSAFVYFLFQLSSVSVMYPHTKAFENEKQINKSAILIFCVNTGAMMLSVLGLLAIAFSKDLIQSSIPMLLLAQNGSASFVLTPIISILIILGSVTTGVNMLSGLVSRSVNAVEKNLLLPDDVETGHLGRNMAFAYAFTLIAFVISQFGLVNVVSIGYSYLGYATFISVFIPFTIHFFVSKSSNNSTEL